MDAVDVLQLDHRKIEKLFSEFQTAATPRSAALGIIRTALLAHAQAEQQVFYPALEQWASDEVEHAIEEHQGVEERLNELRAMDIDGEEFSPKFFELMDSVENHIGEEEAPGGLLEVARQRLSEEQLSDLATEVQRIKTISEQAA